MPIVVNSSGCEACLANPNPKQMNHPMASMCVVAMIKADRFRTPEYREISKHIQSPEERCENTGTCKENAFGPGTELKEIVPKFFERGKCSCKSYAAKMDRWGVDECEQRFEEIVDHLVKQASGWAVPAFASRVVARRWLRMAIDNAKSDWPFVWAYYAKEAKGDELRYSIRSLLKWKPDARVILIGDKPDWYGGEFYEKPRIGPTSFQAFKDCYSKLQMAATIVDKFVWMMDDIYWVSDFKMYHATSPKYVRHVTQEQFYNWKPKNAWAKTRANAYSYLLENSLPTYDFAGHLPQPIRSKTFLEMEDELGLLEEYRNWECIYFNKYYSQHAIPYASKYTRVTKEPKRISPKGVLLNHTSSTYGGMVREYLESAFPEKCAVEK
ncbi:MAG: hypothetical protein CMK32_10060 [Porticoccaceae bacterium]|nr:hypothetical protein [Porticoccaceae bacterium]